MQAISAIALSSVLALLGIWFGYPCAIWVLARVAPKPLQAQRGPAWVPTVSVILATRDTAPDIARRTANLLETDYPAALLEVLVVLDAASANDTLEHAAATDARIRVLRGDAPGGKAATLNAGVRGATGEILVMADSAQQFDRCTIPELVAALHDRRFGAVSGALSLGSAGGRRSPVHWYWAMEKWLRSNEARLHSSIGVTGAVYAVRRALWPIIPDGTLLDDVFVPMTLVMRGHRVGFTYAAHASDLRTFDAKAEGERKSRTLTGVLQLTKLIPNVLTTQNPVLIQFVMHKLARLCTPIVLVVGVLATTALAITALVQDPRVLLPPLLAAIAAIAVVPALRRSAWQVLRWTMSLQSATLRAINNGVRGRWSVWQNSR